MDTIPPTNVGDPIFLTFMYDLDLEIYVHAKVLTRSCLLVEVCVYMSRKIHTEITDIT